MFDYIETMTYRLTAEQIAALTKAKAITIRGEKFEGILTIKPSRRLEIWSAL